MKILIADIIYIFLNYIVANIPIWIVRKTFYILFGMKIGKKSRINMKCVVWSPWKITIGENSIINEYCFLDGRGELIIGDNVSVSIYSILFTASHYLNSETFQTYNKRVEIQDGVWIGARSIILPGTTMEEYSVLGAGSTASKRCLKHGVYSGIPAELIKMREVDYIEFSHKEFFR